MACILKPDVKKGILIFSDFTQPPNMDNLSKLGLKTEKQFQSEGVVFGRSKIHPYIFVRALYYSREIDYSTTVAEINSYGEWQIGNIRVFIRVDPNKTSVFQVKLETYSNTLHSIIEKIWLYKIQKNHYLNI